MERSFDVEALGRAYDAGSLRFARRMQTAIAGAGVFALVLGLLFLSVIPETAAVRTDAVPIFIVGGLGVMGVGVAGRLTVRSPSRRIVVSDKGFRLEGLDGEQVMQSWSDTRLKIELWDYRAVPQDNRIDEMRDVEFVLRPKGRLDAAIPLEATKALLSKARELGMNVSGWSDSRPRPGPVCYVRITAP